MRKTNFWWWNLGRGRHCRLVQLLGRLSQTDQSQDRLAGTFAPFVKAVPVLSIIRMFAFVTRFATLTNGMGNVLWANAWGNETKGKCVRKKKTGGKKKNTPIFAHGVCTRTFLCVDHVATPNPLLVVDDVVVVFRTCWLERCASGQATRGWPEHPH